jgi:hypothetical protein
MLLVPVTYIVLAMQARSAPTAAFPASNAEFHISDTSGLAGYWAIQVVPSGAVIRLWDTEVGSRDVDSQTRRRLSGLVLDARISGGERLFGSCIIDGRERELRAVVDERRRSLRICDLPTTGKVDREAREALRVWYAALDVLAPGTSREPNDARILAQQH